MYHASSVRTLHDFVLSVRLVRQGPRGKCPLRVAAMYRAVRHLLKERGSSAVTFCTRVHRALVCSDVDDRIQQ